MKHIIKISESERRSSWECSCGHGGSVPAGRDVEIAAERHLGEGDRVAYQYPA